MKLGTAPGNSDETNVNSVKVGPEKVMLDLEANTIFYAFSKILFHLDKIRHNKCQKNLLCPC